MFAVNFQLHNQCYYLNSNLSVIYQRVKIEKSLNEINRTRKIIT